MVGRDGRECIDADVLETLGLLSIEVASSGEDLAADDDRFLNELRALHATPDKDSARAARSAISLMGGFTVDAVCSFVLAYTKAVKQHAKAVAKLGDRVVLGIFLDGVESELMRKRLKGGSPATWKEAAKDLVRRVREHDAKAKEVAGCTSKPSDQSLGNRGCYAAPVELRFCLFVCLFIRDTLFVLWWMSPWFVL